MNSLNSECFVQGGTPGRVVLTPIQYIRFGEPASGTEGAYFSASARAPLEEAWDSGVNRILRDRPLCLGRTFAP